MQDFRYASDACTAAIEDAKRHEDTATARRAALRAARSVPELAAVPAIDGSLDRRC